MRPLTKEFLIAALNRAVWTFAEVFLGFMTVGMTLSEVEWLKGLSVSAVAFIISFLKSIVVGLPEAQNDGSLLIDESGETTKWLLKVDTPLEDVSKMKAVRLVVDPHAILPSDDPTEVDE